MIKPATTHWCETSRRRVFLRQPRAGSVDRPNTHCLHRACQKWGTTVSLTKKPTYTRSELAKLLDVSISTIRRLENKELFPKTDSDGVHRFDYAEVAELARRRAVPTSAETTRVKRVRLETKAMALFDAGNDPVDVMRRLRMTCEEIMGLWQFYKAARRKKRAR